MKKKYNSVIDNVDKVTTVKLKSLDEQILFADVGLYMVVIVMLSPRHGIYFLAGPYCTFDP